MRQRHAHVCRLREADIVLYSHVLVDFSPDDAAEYFHQLMHETMRRGKGKGAHFWWFLLRRVMSACRVHIFKW